MGFHRRASEYNARGQYYMDPITSFSVETIEVLLGLIKAGNYTQALIILYSAIDTMACFTHIDQNQA